MNTNIENIESSKYAQQLKQECMESIPHRRGKEIFLLVYFLIMFVIIVAYLWVNALIYDYWFFVLLGLTSLTCLAGYLIDRRYRPDWRQSFLEILKEMNGVNVSKLAEFINAGQPFLGANWGTQEKFLKIAEQIARDHLLDLVIQGDNVYLKGFEPPPEEKKEDESEEKHAQD
jgi:hypothetical protein